MAIKRPAKSSGEVQRPNKKSKVTSIAGSVKPSTLISQSRLMSASSSFSGNSSSEDGSEDHSEEDDDDDEGDIENDKAAMLALFEARQREMLGLDDLPTNKPSKKALGKRKASEDDIDVDEEEDEEEDGFHGFGADGDELDFDVSGESGSDSELGSDEEGFDEDDGMDGLDERETPKAAAVVTVPTNVTPTVVVVDGSSSRASGLVVTSKADYKRFMSSKSSKMMDLPPTNPQPISRNRESATKDEEDKDNLSLDKALHTMLMTNILPNAAQHSRSVDKRNAMSGRVLEIASMAGIGKGSEKIIASTAQVNFPAKVKAGIMKAKATKSEKARAESEAAGSWVKGLGGLGDSGGRAKTAAQQRNQDKRLERKDRDRGLAMGIGKFEGGMLRLSKSEIAKGSGAGERSSGKRPKRGGGGGGRGGGGGGRGGKRK